MARRFVGCSVFISVILLFFTVCIATPLHIITYNTGNSSVVPNHIKRAKIFVSEVEKMILEMNTKDEHFVLFLQQVFTNDFTTDLQQLSKKHNIYMTQTYEADSKNYNHGLVILTNFRADNILEERFIPWEKDAYQVSRGILTLCLNYSANDQPLCFVNLHTAYTYKPKNGLSTIHDGQLQQLKSYVQTIPFDTIVAGDFNLGSMKWNKNWKRNKYTKADPQIENYWENYAAEMLSEGFYLVKADQEQRSFSDKNTLVQHPGPGVTLMRFTNLEVPYYGQIDHIFFKFNTPSIEFCTTNDMLFTEVYLESGGEKFELSDHYGIAATFNLQTPATLLTKQ